MTHRWITQPPGSEMRYCVDCRAIQVRNPKKKNWTELHSSCCEPNTQLIENMLIHFQCMLANYQSATDNNGNTVDIRQLWERANDIAVHLHEENKDV